MSWRRFWKQCSAGFLGFVVSCAAFAAEAPTIRIGVQNSFGPTFYTDSFAPTMLTLRSLFPGILFQSEQLPLDQLLQKLRDRQLDLFFADSGVFSYARHELGSIQIAACAAGNADDPRYQTAMAVVVRYGSRIKTLTDTLDARVVSDEPESVGTWLAFLSLLSDRGVSRDLLLQLTRASDFTHYEFPGALSAVISGEADVAVVPACELEAQELSGSASAGIRLQVSDEVGADAVIHVEPLEAELALVNLVKNAAQATLPDEKGQKRVDFTVAGDDHWVCFWVRDYGKLCTAEAIQALSAPHQSGREGGLGIGLFLVKRIAESHGGSVSFGLAEGHGVVAELRFPRKENA